MVLLHICAALSACPRFPCFHKLVFCCAIASFHLHLFVTLILRTYCVQLLVTDSLRYSTYDTSTMAYHKRRIFQRPQNAIYADMICAASMLLLLLLSQAKALHVSSLLSSRLTVYYILKDQLLLNLTQETLNPNTPTTLNPTAASPGNPTITMGSHQPPVMPFPLSLSINTTNVNSPHMATTTTTNSSSSSSPTNVTNVSSQSQAAAVAEAIAETDVDVEAPKQGLAAGQQQWWGLGGLVGVLGGLLFGVANGIWSVLGLMKSMVLHMLMLRAVFAAAKAVKGAVEGGTKSPVQQAGVSG